MKDKDKNKIIIIVLSATLIIIATVSTFILTKYYNLPSKLIESDAKTVDKYLSENSSSINHPYEGIVDIRNKIKSGYYDEILADRKQQRIADSKSNLPDWLKTSNDDSDIPKLSNYSEMAIENNTINLLKENGGTDAEFKYAISLVHKYPNWLPNHIALVVRKQIYYGMTMEQVALSYGRPYRENLTNSYSIWWYNHHWGKRDILAFDIYGILVYYSLDR